MHKYLSEAFKEMEMLDVEKNIEDDPKDSETFDFDADGLGELKKFLDNDAIESNDTEIVIDIDANTDSDLKDSYIGDVILSCPVCQARIYKEVSEVELDSEDDETANKGEACPYCRSEDGFKIIGQVAPFEEANEDNNDSDEDDSEVEPGTSGENVKTDSDETLDEALSDRIKARLAKKKASSGLEEDFKNVSITTDDTKMDMTSEENGKVTITTEPVENASEGDEIIAPISDTTKAEIETTNSEDELDDTSADATITDATIDDEPTDDGFQDVEIDELDEKEFDELGESYLKKVYENVEIYRTTSGKISGNKLILEGAITFKSGKKANTKFVFEAKDITKAGKVRFIGEILNLSKNKKAFSIEGRIDSKKLVTESLTYNYRAKDAKTGKSERLYGTIHR
jgi:hypothetical protein